MDKGRLENNLNGSKDTSFVKDKMNKRSIFVSSKIKKIQNWTKEEDQILMQMAKKNGYKNWKEVSKHLPGKSSIQCSARYKRIRPGIVKGAWTIEEDEALMSYICKFGKNWSLISKYMPSRSGKQIRDRYLNALDPNILRIKFSPEEDLKIIELYHLYGTQWSKIAKNIPRRTGDMIKNRFYSTLRKQIHSDDYRSGLNKRKKEKIELRKDLTSQINEENYEQMYNESSQSPMTRSKRRRVLKNFPKNHNTQITTKTETNAKKEEDGENFVFKPQPISRSNSLDSKKILNIYNPNRQQAPIMSNLELKQSNQSSFNEIIPNIMNNNLIKIENDTLINQEDLHNQLNILKQFLYITHSKLNMFNEPLQDGSGVSQMESNILNRAFQLNMAAQLGNINTHLTNDYPMSSFKMNYCGKS